MVVVSDYISVSTLYKPVSHLPSPTTDVRYVFSMFWHSLREMYIVKSLVHTCDL